MVKTVLYACIILLVFGCAFKKVTKNGEELERQEAIPMQDLGVKIDDEINDPYDY